MAGLGAYATTSALGARRYALLETVLLYMRMHFMTYVFSKFFFVYAYVVNVYLAGITSAFSSHVFYVARF